MEKVLQDILGQIKEMKTEMTEMKTEIKSLNNRMGKVESKVDIIEGKLDEQRDILRAVEHRTEENSAQLTALGESMNYIKGDISNINNRLDYQIGEIAKTKEELSILKAVK